MKRPPRRVHCPVTLSIELLGGKWKPVILMRLEEQPRRYGELRRLIPALSDKMLSERLADLQALDLVERGGDARYRLTIRGESLRPLLGALHEWGAAQVGFLDIAFD